jgi:hypothetical protein
MPVQLIKTEFYDNFGNGPFTSYVSNAGDQFKVVHTLHTNIRISSLTNPLFLDPSINTIQSSSISWLTEGFRVDDLVQFTIYTSTGTIVQQWTTAVTYVDDFILDVNSIPYWYNLTAGEFIVIEVTNRNRDDLDVLFNHVQNATTGNQFSIIDGEATRAVFVGVDALAVSAGLLGSLVGNQSGQFLISVELERLANPLTYQKAYEITIQFVNSGIYSQSSFDTSGCLKTYTQILWSASTGELSNRFSLVINPDANTGWFNQPNNTSILDSSLVQGISEMDYCTTKHYKVIVDGPLTDLSIGSAYVSLDETYYKNQLSSQNNLTMIVPSEDILSGDKTSYSNDSGAQYEIQNITIVTAGTEHTIEFDFVPNAQFDAFMSAREVGDRLFYLWIKCGNSNLLAYADQLTCEPPVGAPLSMIDKIAYFDHSENITSQSGVQEQFEFNTEDDLSFYGTFLLTKGNNYQSVQAVIEAYNSTTEDAFTLLEVNFNFSAAQISGDGRYLLNETQNVISSLPNTSVKRNATLQLAPSLDTMTDYGVSVYLPFLLRWEYWLQQLNASTDFYPNQNKNWTPYDNTGDWSTRLRITLTDDLTHDFVEEITIKDYDSEPIIDQTIELYVDSTNQNVGIVTEGQLMRVVATHTLNNATAWNQSEIWGMITIEPFESGQRWILSSVVPYDNNVNNPLYPLSGSLINISYPTNNVAVMECFFDPTRINLENGVKFTTKIKGCNDAPFIVIEKTTTDGDTKTTTDGDIKTLAL